MTDQVQAVTEAPKPSDKELNFRKQQQMYEKMLEEKEQRLATLEKQVQSQSKPQDDDDSDDEPYVDKKRLNKTLAKFGQQTRQETQSEIQKAVHVALQEERKSNWLKQNPDFHDVLQHAQKFADSDPELAETILTMPEGFERQKLVYKNIKALGLHKPASKEPTVQEKIDANRRSPYYQPSGVGTSPYSGTSSDFSKSGQKSAYENMIKLKEQLRLG
jgi:hypothetical protein